jgi:hypothetical protein
VKVAGTATIIHQTIPIRKSFPFPRTRLLTSFPSKSATYTLRSVRTTRKKLWLMSSLTSVLFHPGMIIFKSLNRLLKNSRFSSTFFRLWFGSSVAAVPPYFLDWLCRIDAAFCSFMALRIRFISDINRVR